MTELAKTYLGNINQDSDLARLITQEPYWQVSLSHGDRHKGRIHTQTKDHLALGIIKNRDRLLQTGDVFRTESNKLLLINIQAPKLLVLDLSSIDPDLAPAKLVHLGHVLGNHHQPIIIQDDKIYVQLNTTAKIIENIIRDTQIAGLKITYETRSNLKEITFSAHHHH